MDPQESEDVETEYLLQIAAGADPLTAFAAVSDDTPSGCFAVVLVVLVVVLASVA